MANAAPHASRNLESPAGGSCADKPAASRRPNVDLTAFTQRDDFLLELGETLGGQASIHPVDSIDTALESITSTKRGQVLVIDARGTHEVRGDVERAHREAPHAVVLVFAESHAEKQAAAALKGTSVFAVLTIPIEGAKTTAVLDAAMRDAGNRSTAAGKAAQPEESTIGAFRLGARAAALSAEEPGRSHRWLWAAVGVAALLLAAGAGWYVMRGRAASPLATTATAHSRAGRSEAGEQPLGEPAVDTSIVQGKVDDLLEQARRAMRELHYTSPKGRNALVYYRSALVADPTSGEAKDGLRRVGDVLVSRFNAAMSGGDYANAALALATLRVAQPSDPRIGPFQVELSDARISKALAAGDVARAAVLLRDAKQSGAVPKGQLITWQTQIAQLKQSAKVQSLTALIESRIQSGELTGPAGDSAERYLHQLRTLAPTSPATQQAAGELTRALLAKARQDALAGKSAHEARWLAAAHANGASQSELATFEQQLATSESQAARARTEHWLSLVRERLASGALTAPAADSAAYYLTELDRSHPAGAAQAAADHERRRLAAALLARASREMRSGRKSGAEADLSQAKTWGASTSAVLAIESAGSQGAASPKADAGPDLAQLAAALERIHYVPPRYPQSALENRTSGSVTVAFVVDKSGRTRDLRIVHSTPPGVFERSVLDAIRHWRYRPARYGGKPIDVPVRTLIRFELPN